jgi:hypothetical protein
MSRLAVACLIAFSIPHARAQSKVDPQDLYHRVRDRVLADIVHLPNYTCVQTVTRRVYAPHPAGTRGAALQACSQIIADRAKRQGDLPLESWDRLRLDVGIADKHEVYSWVGASRFAEAGIQELAGGGQTNTGDFASTLFSVFSDHPSMRFQGETQVDGRRVFEYTYETPVETSHYQVRFIVGKLTTAYHGSVFLDPETADVVRVTTVSEELPLAIGYCQVSRDLKYARVRIGPSDALLPREAQALAIDREGGERLNVNSYAQCREYLGESVVRFDDADNGAASPDAVADQRGSQPAAIPSGLKFDCRIVTPLDSENSAAGDPVEAVLRSPIRDFRGRVLAPRGAHIHGRLTRFLQRSATETEKASYEIAMRFSSIEFGKTQVPFAANLSNVHARGATESNLRMGVGLIVFHEQRLNLRQLDTTWLTARPDAAK